jgi:threonyl-tRNA synthetase
MKNMKADTPLIKKMRHSCEHVLTQAMLRLYPGIKMAMGPATEDGFYFDFDPSPPVGGSGQVPKISEADFPKIEKEMARIIKADLPIKREEITLNKAKKLFAGNPYKQEWLKEIAKRGEKVVIYRTGKEFVDLCAGPHVSSTGRIGAFKLLSIAGAYWHGDEKNKMLTRIYGTCFATKKELDDYLKQCEEAEKRDHRKIGHELDLFSFHPDAPADVFWHPKGYTLMKILFQYWREIHEREGYLEVRTPEILTRKIWDQSGHTSFFIEKMYRVLSPQAKIWDLAIKPMNCDGGILIYKSRLRSYREFPLRLGELGIVHRYEASGETLGIIRPREFTQDDAHIYCTPEQVKDELKKVMDLCFEVYQTFGLKLDHLELSTRPEKSIGSKEIWDRAESLMKQVLKEKKMPHQINEGEGAFYGPKFDFHLKDALGRTWQCSTIQLDFAQPENFNLEYTTQEGKRERPVMIHRVLYGSVERFLGILIEHYAGAFPVWLAPLQVIIIPISDKHLKYARKLGEKIKQAKIRLQINERPETASAKIRDAEMQKIPYILVVGEREEKAGSVNVRIRGEKVLGEMKLDAFINLVLQDIAKKRQV